MADTDEPAKRFDNLIYGLMLSQIEALPAYDYGDYKMKVNRYVNDHQDILAIQIAA